MRRAEHVGLVVIAVDRAGYLIVLQQPLRSVDVLEPVLARCVHIRDSKQPLVAALDFAGSSVSSPASLDCLERFSAVGFPKQLGIQRQRDLIRILRFRISIQRTLHGGHIGSDRKNALEGRLGKLVDLFVGEIGERLEHLIVQIRIRDIVLLVVRTAEMTPVFLEAALVMIPVIIVFCQLELAVGEDDADVFLDQVMLSAPAVFNDGRHIVDLTELEEVEAG